MVNASLKEIAPVKVKDLTLYSDANYTIIPLNGKIPTKTNWTNTSYKDFSKFPQEREVGHNVGLKLEKNLLVVDIDPRNFKEFNSFEALCSDIKVNLIEECNVRVKTGGGGMHLYFIKPPIKVTKELKAYPGVEFKTYGTQVVIPPSIHPDTGNPYVFAEGSLGPKDIGPAPSQLLDLIVRSETVEKIKGIEDYKNDPQDIKRAQARLAKEAPAVEGENGDNHTYRVACLGKEMGLSPDVFFPLLCEWNQNNNPPWDPESLLEKMYNAYNYAQNDKGIYTSEVIFDQAPVEILLSPEQAMDQTREIVDWRLECTLDESGNPKKQFKNLKLFLQHYESFQGKLAFNEFSNSVVWLSPMPWHDINPWDSENGRPIDDDDLLQIKGFFNKMNVDFSVNQCYEAARLVGIENKFHPLRNWFSQLEWDGTPRVDQWVPRYLGANDNLYTRAVGRKTLVAMVSRVFEPGCKFDYMLVLEGKQGIGKSTALRILGGQYFTDAFIDMKSKDAALLLQGHMLVEIPELQSFTYVDMNTFKAFTSRQFDHQRNPYDRMTSKIPRQCVMVGTTNHTDYCKDETGNRRLWPVKVDGVNIEQLMRDRDQLFAEAVMLHKLGEPLFISDPQIEKLALEEQDLRHHEDDWQSEIAQWLVEGNIDTCSGAEIWQNCFGKNSAQFDRRSQHRVARCMSNLGFEKCTEKHKGIKQKVYKKI